MSFSFNNLAGSNSTAIMGIINLSPDSFYSRSIPFSITDVFNVAKIMIQEGVHILDVGAETTRPGSKSISVKLELERLLPVIAKFISLKLRQLFCKKEYLLLMTFLVLGQVIRWLMLFHVIRQVSF